MNHNAGPNHRAINFNRECWLLLIGFPLDYWSTEHISGAIKSFERLLVWERDDDCLAHILIKARVTDLQDVPQFIDITEGDGFQGFSWTVQCEIMQQNLLGVFPQDEDQPPNVNHRPNLLFHQLHNPVAQGLALLTSPSSASSSMGS